MIIRLYRIAGVLMLLFGMAAAYNNGEWYISIGMLGAAVASIGFAMDNYGTPWRNK